MIYLCALDSDEPIPSSWCINSLLANLDLQKDRHHKKSNNNNSGKLI